MDLAALIDPVIAFFNHGIGAVIRDVMTFLYNLFYPANAPAATPVQIPR